MKKYLFLILMLIVFGCQNDERIEFAKDLNIDWTDQSKLATYDVLYTQLNFNPFIDEEIMGKGIEELLVKDSLYILDDSDQEMLIEMILDRSNFSRGECGTFALNGGFLLVRNDTIKGIIEMGCGYSQWRFDPWNTYALDGSLSEIGFDKMTKLLDEINRKMKKRIPIKKK